MKEIERSKEVAYWVDEIDTYERDFSKWESRSKKIVKRYMDDRSDVAASKAQFNILWSNVQTLSPALFAQNPAPNIDRRFEDDDRLGTLAARALERCVTYFVNEGIFFNVMRQVVQDRLLSGRGTAWVRYDVEAAPTVTDDATGCSVDENVCVDYVHWADFGHSYARTWEELDAVWRMVPMDRGALVKRFGDDVGKAVPMEKNKDKKSADETKTAIIYEIWCKSKKKVYWVHKEMPDVLDERDDPLHLKEFFPCPKPLYSTLGNDNLIPTPDYIQYQDQADELDSLTGRINSITKALKVAGVYDKSAQGIDRLLSEGVENKLIPVEQWAVFAEKGGLQGVVSFMPIKEIAEVLISLYDARDRVKQDLYEVTGISDIIRGATDAGETATAQQIKGQFATLRLDAMQGDVARFSRDLVRIMSEIIAEHFDAETIARLSAITIDEQDQSEGITWEAVKALIADDILRSFRISIETDSTIKADQDAERQARIEFLSAAGAYIQQAVQIPNPELAPLLMEMLQFGVKGFRVSREIEGAFYKAMKQINERAENPPPPQPNPEEQKMQVEMQMKGHELQQAAQIKQQELAQAAQGDQAKLAQQAEIERMKAEYQFEIEKMKLSQTADIEKFKITMQGQLEQFRAQNQLEIEDRKVKSQERLARVRAKPGTPEAMVEMDSLGIDGVDTGKTKLDMIAEKMEDQTQTLASSLELLGVILQESKRVKNVAVIRDRDGKIAGANIQ